MFGSGFFQSNSGHFSTFGSLFERLTGILQVNLVGYFGSTKVCFKIFFI